MELAPKAESYLPQPNFKFSPRQREVDFAQLIASGGDPVGSLLKAAIVPPEESFKLTQSELYALATNLLRSEAIQERIDHFLVLHRASMDTSAARIKQELASIAFVDPALIQEDQTYEDVEGNVKTRVAEVRDLRKLPRYVRAAIKEFHVDRDGNPRYKFHDKLKSVQMLADLENLFGEANKDKAPQVTFNLGGQSTDLRQVIDITPPPNPEPQPTIPEFLR